MAEVKEVVKEESALASTELAFTPEQVQALAAGLDEESAPVPFPEGPLSHKVFQFELHKDSMTEEGYFEGHGSVFGNRDLQDDIVMPGAFAESIKRHNGRGPTVKMLWQHDSENPIGPWPLLEEDKKGLKVGGQLLMEVQQSREAYVLLKAGALDGLSIGYQTEKHETDNETGIRKLLKINLWEISLVTFPANPKARVRRVKSVRDLEGILRDAGFSRREARAIASHGHKGIVQRDTAPDVKALDALAAALGEVHKALRSSDRG